MTFRESAISEVAESTPTWSAAPGSRGSVAKTALSPVRRAAGARIAEDDDGPVELEETPALPEAALRASAPDTEDPVRIHLKEIGKVSLLTAAQEVAIGRRIEAGQVQLRRALAGIPMATARLLALVDRARQAEGTLEDIILLPEGGEPEPDEIRPLLGAFGRIRRLEREIERLEAGLSDGRRSANSRAAQRKAIAQHRGAIQAVVETLPLKPALVDDLVATVRRHAGQMRALRPGRELRAQEAEAGLARKPLLAVIAEIEQHDRVVRAAKKELMEANL